MSKSNEYLMLREEILHLGSIENQTFNFMYAFVGAILAYSFSKNDTLTILISYVVVIPAYKRVISFEEGVYKIGAYLYVFLEGEEFNWERRNLAFYDELRRRHKESNRYIQSFHYPFLFISSLITLFFLISTDYQPPYSLYGVLKVVAAILLYLYVLMTAAKHRFYSVRNYIEYWEGIKKQSS